MYVVGSSRRGSRVWEKMRFRERFFSSFFFFSFLLYKGAVSRVVWSVREKS